MGGGKQNPSQMPTGNKAMDDAYRSMKDFNNLSKVNQDRIQRIIDQSDGQDLDFNKVQRQFAKNKWDFPQGPS